MQPLPLHFRKHEMRAAAAQRGHEVFASVDCLRRDGVTVSQRFASFASHEDFARAVLAAPPGARCFYEMIREARPCRLYFDVEWTAAPTGRPPDIAGVQALVGAVFARMWPGRALGECVLLEGSRATPKGFKHSYHLVYPDCVFASNTGAMKLLAERAAKAAAGVFGGVRCIDCAVYTRDRAFRAPLCHKLADESRTALRWADNGGGCAARMLRSMVTHVDPGAQQDVVPELHALVVAAARPKLPQQQQQPPRPRVRATASSEHGELQALLQRWLARRGGLGRASDAFVTPAGVGFRYTHGVPNRPEPCLAHGPFSAVTHRCDNQFIHVDKDSYVRVVCPHGAKCQKRFFNFGRVLRNGQPALAALGPAATAIETCPPAQS